MIAWASMVEVEWRKMGGFQRYLESKIGRIDHEG